MNIDPKGQEQNEFLVSFMSKDIDILRRQIGEGNHLTPTVHKLFSLMEMLGVEGVVEGNNGKPHVVYSDTEFTKKLHSAVGLQYISALVKDLYEVLNQLGIQEFTYNKGNRKWKRQLGVTRRKLLAFLESSIKKNE